MIVNVVSRALAVCAALLAALLPVAWSASPAAGAVRVSPQETSLPAEVLVRADCADVLPAARRAAVEVPALDERVVVPVRDGRVRSRVALPRQDGERAPDAVQVRVTCQDDEGDEVAAGAARVGVVEAAAPAAREVRTRRDEPLSAALPIAIAVGVFLVVGSISTVLARR